LKSRSSQAGVNAALLLLPCWLLVFYFKNEIAGWLVKGILKSLVTPAVSATIVFFIATLLKILLLLVFVVFIISFFRTWLPAHRVKKFLLSVHPVFSNVMAGLLGVFTPFCSCSAVPVFIGFLEAGIPLGTTFTFLIASPLVNEIILVMLASLFGIKVALIYMVAGLAIAVISGSILGKLRLEKYLPPWLLDFRDEKGPLQPIISLNERLSAAFTAVKETFNRTWVFILAGVAVGAAIHSFIPETWLNTFLSADKWYTLPVSVIAGVPLYACSASVVPIAFALADKGAPLGTAMAFVMSVAALSLPEFIMLKKIISLRLILIFAGIVFTGNLVVGYLFNWLL
jgi:uncharacterized membrane protein YraQ (UPF0718 family)